MTDEVRKHLEPLIKDLPYHQVECEKPENEYSDVTEIDGKYYESKEMQLSDISDSDLTLILLAKANKRLNGIFYCAAFFVALTVISLIATIVSVTKILDIFS